VDALARLHGGLPVVSTPSTLVPGTRIRANDPVYWELSEFLVDEAALLDGGRLGEWCALMSPDVRYRVPVRVSSHRDDGDGFSESMFHLDETIATLKVKTSRLEQPGAWTEEPPSRTRRFVTDIRVFREDEHSYRVLSNLLLLRYRFDLSTPDIVSGQRDDMLRVEADHVEIARRTVFLDQTTLGTANLAVFL
jgi:3-phenylpropionate/cinnamic acid dioxygenase small subunit